jgi:hypothetical protein
MRQTLGLILVVLGAQACSSQSAYIPEERATSTLGGRTAASYALPSDQDQQGDLRVASYGVSKLERTSGDSLEAIHLRLAVSDTGAQPMVLDTREQRLQLPDGRQLAPAYVSAKAGVPPLIRVMPGSARTVDLYFPIPLDLVDESSPPQFDAIWRVRVGDDTVSQITPFDKVAVDPAVARQELAEDIVEGDIYTVDPYWGPGIVGPPVWGW